MADQHAGSALGLMSPAVRLLDDEGAEYAPGLGATQRWLWRNYEDALLQTLELAGDEATGPRRAPEGFRYGQQWFNWSGHHRAGIYQRVGVPAGQEVTFTVQAMAWYSTGNDPARSERNPDDPGYAVRVGIDPTGGTDWQSEAVIWSDPVYPHDAWYAVSVCGRSEGTVTVYVYGEPTWPVTNVNCYVGDAELWGESDYADPEPDWYLPSNAPLTLAASTTREVATKARWWQEEAVRRFQSGETNYGLAIMADLVDRETGLLYRLENMLP